MAAKIWRCMVCGDGYVGEERPTNCPFCGAHGKYIILAKKWQPKEGLDMPVKNFSEKSKKNVQQAIELEKSNSAFYFCSAEKCKDAEGKAMFKALGKIEREHAVIWKKILQFADVPADAEIPKSEVCPAGYDGELNESHERESKAIEHYKKFAKEAIEPRLKQLFNAIVEVETDHLGLSEEMMRGKGRS